jgi:hypothetical protein
LSAVFQRRDGLINLGPRKRLSFVLSKKWPELLWVELRPACNFEREDTLPLIRRQYLLDLRRRCRRLFLCGRLSCSRKRSQEHGSAEQHS